MWTAVSLAALLAGGVWLFVLWGVRAAQAGVSLAAIALTGIAVYATAFLIVTAAWFAIAWVYRAPRPPAARIGVRATARLFCWEWVTLMGSGPRMAAAWWFMREPPPRPGAQAVLLVHGVLCNSGVWLGMRGRLARLTGAAVYTISYGPPLASIEQFAEALAGKVDAIRAATGARQVVLVGHSMGGLVARAYLRRFGAGKVSRVVTIGTPHNGSIHAWLFLGTSLGQLRPGNQWMAELNAGAVPSVPIVSIWSWHDSMVAPQDSCVLPGARNVPLVGIGHNALLRDPDVTRLVAAEVAAAR